MDCIRTCQSRITTQNKYLWVIEGDIKGCFDHVQHAILLKLIRQRVQDERMIGLIEAMLKAGVMEGKFFQHTTEGTPQGGILSPLLANIYLHQFDSLVVGTVRQAHAVRESEAAASRASATVS